MVANRKVFVKARLFELNKTQSELARETSIPRAFVSMWLHGRYILDENQKARVAEVLAIPVEKLMS